MISVKLPKDVTVDTDFQPLGDERRYIYTDSDGDRLTISVSYDKSRRRDYQTMGVRVTGGRTARPGTFPMVMVRADKGWVELTPNFLLWLHATAITPKEPNK